VNCTAYNKCVIDRVCVCIDQATDNIEQYSRLVGGVAQWWNVGLWPANFPCPALDLQLMGDH